MNSSLKTQFGATTTELLTRLGEFSPGQLNSIPFPGSWSAGQVGDHLYQSYEVAGILKGKTEKTSRHPEEKMEKLRQVFLDFDQKLVSPQFILPTEAPIEKKKLLEGLRKRVNFVIDYLEEGHDLTASCLDFELPGTGILTRMEWIQFMTIHTQRHIRQLKNISYKLDENDSQKQIG